MNHERKLGKVVVQHCKAYQRITGRRKYHSCVCKIHLSCFSLIRKAEWLSPATTLPGWGSGTGPCPVLPCPPHGASGGPRDLLQRRTWTAATRWSWERWGDSQTAWRLPGTLPGAKGRRRALLTAVSWWRSAVPSEPPVPAPQSPASACSVDWDSWSACSAPSQFC